MPPKEQMALQKQGKHYGNLSMSKSACNVLYLNDKVKILDMWKGSMSLGKVGWHYRKNESSICSI
jgi:hypothetical protein